MNTFFETNIQKKLREYVKNNFYHASHMQITPDQAHYICSILNNNKYKNIARYTIDDDTEQTAI